MLVSSGDSGLVAVAEGAIATVMVSGVYLEPCIGWSPHATHRESVEAATAVALERWWRSPVRMQPSLEIVVDGRLRDNS